MPKYAENTAVSTEKSRMEIERTLKKYGADQFLYGTSNNAAMVAFTMKCRQVRFILPLPDKNSDEFQYTPQRRNSRSASAVEEAWEQACRQRWRALYIVIKAKLEAIECGISVFEDEFMSNIVLPNNQLVGDYMRTQIEQAYLSGAMPPMLPMLGSQT
jgi:hypothetical protein